MKTVQVQACAGFMRIIISRIPCTCKCENEKYMCPQTFSEKVDWLLLDITSKN